MKKMLAKIALGVTLVVSALGLAGMSSVAMALTLSATNFCDTSQLTTSTDCVGTIIDPENDTPATYLATNNFFGINNWTQVQKTDGPNNILYNFDVDSVDESEGTWSVSSFNGWSDAVIVLKGGTSWSAYLLDVLFLSGDWNTLGLLNAAGNHPDLSHASLYVGGIKSNNNIVPLPAALPLLLGGLGGLAWLGRIRKRSGSTAA